jgi:hypothetical protein
MGVPINKLSALDSLSLGDLLAVYSQSNGDARKAAISLLLAFMQDNLTFPSADISEFTTQRAAPSGTGFSVSITAGSDNIHLILTPNAGYAAGTIVLPANLGAADKQEILVNTTQQVTALTIDGNGAVAVTGAPTSLGAEDFFRLKYDLGTQTWFRVG